MLFIFAFSAAFGKENFLIGVSTITAMLMFLERDLTAHPITNTFKLISLNLFIGIAAFSAGVNVWLGIPINFIAMFVISYLLIFNLKNPLYFPFSLQYIFLLSTPVAASEMPLRLASLIFGGIAIMGLQMLVNRNRVKKNGDSKIKTIANSLTQKIEHLKNNKDTTEIYEQIAADINSLRNMIYDKREEDFYLTKEGRLKLNLSASFDKINLLLSDLTQEEIDHEILDDLHQCLTLVCNGIDDTKTAKELDEAFNLILNKYDEKEINTLFVLRLLSNIAFLKEDLIAIRALNKSHYDVVEKFEQIPTKFKQFTLGGKTAHHTTSIKFSYAFRVALAITIGAFITDFFDLNEGRWILFTVLSVIIPIFEQSKRKMQDRVFATFVGAILISVLFTLFDSELSRSIILMIAGYLMNFIKVYRYSTTIVTFTAIGGVALATDTTPFLTIERIVMVIFGVILALLINQFVFKYDLEESNEDLKDMYDDTILAMLNELKGNVRGDDNKHSAMNMLIITNMIEDRLKLNNQNLDTPWLLHYRLLASNLYELYQWIDAHELKKDLLAQLITRIKLLSKHLENNTFDTSLISEIENQITSVQYTDRKITWSIILDITLEVQQIQKNKKLNI